MKNYLPLLFAVGFPIYFVLLWSSVLFMLSRLGGWHRLAQSFPAPEEPVGRKFGTTSARIGWTNYNNCLTTGVSDNGLFIQPWLPFRLFHPALLIPWSALSPFVETKFLWATSYSTDVRLKDGQSVKLVLISHPLVEEVKVRSTGASTSRTDSAWSN